MFDIHGSDLSGLMIGLHFQLRLVQKPEIEVIKLTFQVCALCQSVALLSSTKAGLGKAELELSRYELRTALKVWPLSCVRQQYILTSSSFSMSAIFCTFRLYSLHSSQSVSFFYGCLALSGASSIGLLAS